MKYLLSLLGCLFTVVLYAQSPEREAIDEQNREAYELLRKSHRETAYAIAQKTYAQSQQLGYDKGELWAKLISANYFYNTNKTDTARLILEACLEADYENRPIEEFGIAYWYLARIYRRNRDFEEASRLYNTALDQVDDLNKPYLQGSILNDMGVSNGMQSNYPEALDYFIRSYELMESSGLDFQDYSSSLINIGMVYSRMGEYDQALKYYWPILESNLQLDDTIGISVSYNSIGGAYSFRLQHDSALYYYELATQWANWGKDIKGESIGLLNQAEMLLVFEKYEEALSHLKEALSLVEKPYSISPAESIIRLTGRTYMALGQNDSGRFYLWKAMSMARQAEQKQTLMSVYESLYDHYRDEQQSDSALHYFELYQSYKDSIFGEEKSNEYSDLRVKLETLEKEKEIALLEADKKVSQLQSRNLIMGSATAGLLAITIIVVLIYRRKGQEQKIELLEADMQQARDQLTRQTLHMIHMNNGLDQVEQDIKSLNTIDDSGRVSKVISKININKALDKEWENFTTYFNRVNTGFFDKLDHSSRDLSNNELRMCALLKLRLSNHEIATILNIEAKSVRMAKYRLKKKLDLAEELDLGEYLHSLN